MNWFTDLENRVVKDEEWVIGEITKGWAAIQSGLHQAEIDVLGVFSWLNTNHSQILGVFTTALTDLAAVGSIIPQTAPYVQTATKMIDAATAAVDLLSKGIQKGTTPLSTIANAYHAVKDAQSAVNIVLKAKTAAPSAAS